MASIIGVETHFPQNRHSQREIMECLQGLWPEHRAVLERLTTTAGVEHRHTVYPITEVRTLGGFERRNKIFIESMVELLATALQRLQDHHPFDWKDIGIVTSTTITGVSVPSIEARVMNRLPLPSDVVRNPLFGLGCLGGVAGLNRTRDLLKARPTKLGLLIAAEACSLTFQHDDISMANMVACSLFGDGVAVALLAGEDHRLSAQSKVHLLDSMTSFYPDTERIMGWDMVDSGFKIVLSGNVPGIVEQNLRADVERFLERRNLKLSDINSLISHPGGPKVLRAVSESLEKDESFLRHSWEGLRELGNLSSVSVLNVLQRSLEEGLAPGYGLTLAMGPAFNAEMGLIRVDA